MPLARAQRPSGAISVPPPYARGGRPEKRATARLCTDSTIFPLRTSGGDKQAAALPVSRRDGPQTRTEPPGRDSRSDPTRHTGEEGNAALRGSVRVLGASGAAGVVSGQLPCVRGGDRGRRTGGADGRPRTVRTAQATRIADVLRLARGGATPARTARGGPRELPALVRAGAAAICPARPARRLRRPPVWPHTPPACAGTYTHASVYNYVRACIRARVHIITPRARADNARSRASRASCVRVMRAHSLRAVRRLAGSLRS